MQICQQDSRESRRSGTQKKMSWVGGLADGTGNVANPHQSVTDIAQARSGDLSRVGTRIYRENSRKLFFQKLLFLMGHFLTTPVSAQKNFLSGSDEIHFGTTGNGFSVCPMRYSPSPERFSGITQAPQHPEESQGEYFLGPVLQTIIRRQQHLSGQVPLEAV